MRNGRPKRGARRGGPGWSVGWAVAAMLLAELAAQVKAAGQTLHQKLDALFWQYGYHAERQLSLSMPGSQGMKDMHTIMARFRAAPPATLAGLKVVRVRDYLALTEMTPGQPPRPFAGPQGDMVILDLDVQGNYVAARPSGTEPKAKAYIEASSAPRPGGASETEWLQTCREVDARARGIGASFLKLAFGLVDMAPPGGA